MYKVLKEDANSFHVQHPNGSEFKVAKKGLSPKAITKIKGYADGGQVGETDLGEKPIGAAESDRSAPGTPYTPSPSRLKSDQTETPVDTESERTLSPFAQSLKDNLGAALSAPFDATKKVGSAALDLIAPKNPNYVPPGDSSIPQDTSNNVPVTDQAIKSNNTPSMGMTPLEAEATSNPLEASYAMQKQGIQGQAKAESDLSKSQQGYLSAYLASAQKAQDQYQQTRKTLTAERDQSYENTKNQKIDPHQYWNSKDSHSKTQAIIGMALAGIGQGLQGSDHNVAIDMINKQIDRDIAAQKANMDQKNNLFKHNLERTRNEDEAYAITRNQMAGMSAAQLQLAAAKSGDPMATARAQQTLGQLQQDYDMYNHQLALQKAQFASADPTAARISLLLPKEQHAEAFKELGEHAKTTNALNGAQDIMDKIDKLQSPTNRVTSPIQSKSKLDALNGSLTETIMSHSPSKRLNPELVNQVIDPYKINITDNAATRIAKKQYIQNLIKSDAAPTPILSSHGFIPKDNGPVKKSAPVVR